MISSYLSNHTDVVKREPRKHIYYRPYLCRGTEVGFGRKWSEFHIDAIVKRIEWTTGKKVSKNLAIEALQNKGHVIENKFCKTIKFNDQIPFFVTLPPMTIFG